MARPGASAGPDAGRPGAAAPPGAASSSRAAAPSPSAWPGGSSSAVEAQLRIAREGRAGRVVAELARIPAGPGAPAEKVQAAAGLLDRGGYTRD